jgi:hypothetical protein
VREAKLDRTARSKSRYAGLRLIQEGRSISQIYMKLCGGLAFEGELVRVRAIITALARRTIARSSILLRTRWSPVCPASSEQPLPNGAIRTPTKAT